MYGIALIHKNQRKGRENMETSLVIMAAGIGSRFGKKIKQLEPVGKNGEILLEYSVYHFRDPQRS